MRFGVGHSARDGHRMCRELTEQPAVHAPAADFADTVRLKVFTQRHRRLRTERGDRRKTVNLRNVLEDEAHPVAAALAVACAQRPREPLRIGPRHTSANEAAHDFGRRVALRFGVQCVAAEEVDLLELREEAGTGIAAGDALHFGDRQELARLDLIGEEFVTAVVVTRDHQNVAANAGMTCRGEPIRAAALDQLDESVLFGRQITLERVLLVG